MANISKHPNDELNYGVYIIPGSQEVGMNDLSYWHEKHLKADSYISKTLG